MKPSVVVGGARVFLGDCRDVLKTLPDNSVDSIVTDPPYELGFMGKSWDNSGIAYDVTVWEECLRVLKPGGHILAFGGTRTWHRLAVAVEDAGFEIRDNIARFYGDPHYCGCELPEPQMVNWSYGTGEPQTEHGVRSVRDSDIPQTFDVETERGEVLQPVVQEQGLPSAERAESSQGHEDGKESGLEGRGDVQATEGELYGGEVRSSAGVGETNGSERRLHYGAPSGDGSDVRVSFDSDGGGEPQGSQSGEQSPVEPGAVSDERGPQAGRSWPICARCGKPLQPTSSGNLAWVMGSGFPKSLDVSKAIDKRRDETTDKSRVALELRNALLLSGKNRQEIDEHFGTANVSQYWFSPERNAQIVPADKWPWVRDWLGIGSELDAEVWRLNGRKGKPGENWDKREVIGHSSNGIAGGTGKHAGEDDAYGFAKDFDLTAPKTPEAEAWQGWGTALKPAFEPVVVGRKPLVGTVAENVLAWGVGGLNIDGSRIGTTVESWPKTRSFASGISSGFTDGIEKGPTQQTGPAPQGRWPANVVLDEFTAGLLDEQSGVSVSKAASMQAGLVEGIGARNLSARATAYESVRGHDDSGGASRFFYQAKASKRDRNEGLNLCRCDKLQAWENEDQTAPPQADTDQSTPKDTGASGTPNNNGSEWNMSSSGSNTTDNSKMGNRSTTSTATNLTTESTTSSPLTAPHTNASIRGASSETVSGGNPAKSADTRSRSTETTGMSAEKGGPSMDGANPATSPSSSSPSNVGSHQCAECLGIIGGHPTVKPTQLMRYLIKLVTPEGGTVLDPFTGSGSTGKAALLDGYGFIGAELTEEYLPIIEGRLRWAVENRDEETLF